MYSSKVGRTRKQKHYEVLTEMCSSGKKNKLTDTNADVFVRKEMQKLTDTNAEEETG